MPAVRSFFPPYMLQDLRECVAEDTLRKILQVMKSLRSFGEGAPDLVLYHPCGRLEFVEVKSENDKLSPNQLQVLHALSLIDNVLCSVSVAESENSSKRHHIADQCSREPDTPLIPLPKKQRQSGSDSGSDSDTP